MPGMIISASRRTDLPAFYTPWLINRLRSGFCQVANPFRPGQIKRVSLLPEDVDVIVFWTRHAQPLIPYLDELDRRGYRYYFQYSLTNYPRQIERRTPFLGRAIKTIRALSNKIGSQRVIWRYDPILMSESTSLEFHRHNFQQLAQSLRGYARRCVISLYDDYAKARSRLLQEPGFEPLPKDSKPYWRALAGLVPDLVDIAAQNQFEVCSCAEEMDLQPYGIPPGKCIDNDLILSVFGIEVSAVKDAGQRKACGCVVSQDIGRYDTCLFGCQFCYATRSFEKAYSNYSAHNPDLPAL